MNEPLIRRCAPGDAPGLAALWHRVFEDPEELALDFLRLLPELGGGVLAEVENKVIGAAYIVTALSLGSLRPAYLYAVAVAPEYRGLGLGKALTRSAAALGRELGADFICTLPANAGLYPWYEQLIGTRCALYRKQERFPCRAGGAVVPLSAEEYGERREALLAGLPHLSLHPAALRFEQCNCRRFGGDLLAVGDGIAAVYRDEDGLAVIRELLCPAPSRRRELAAAAGAALGAERVELYTPAPEGRAFLAAEPGFVPPDCVWNLCFD